jgi:two-component system, cell cycle sensor histidine kinase and response regulator CckA
MMGSAPVKGRKGTRIKDNQAETEVDGSSKEVCDVLRFETKCLSSAFQKDIITMTAPTPKNETKRLKVLWQYELLDTVPEEVFDELTELAARICEAPIALISLVDEKRQWFKSKVGITINETSRDISFCAYAINQPDLFIVPDATQDPRFAQNLLVTAEPRIRFYAGAPLVTPDGHALGTLCVIDKVPRELRSDQQQALRILARHVVSQLELRRRSRELGVLRRQEEQREGDLKKLRAELTVARRELARRKAKPPAAARSKAKKKRP